ncbi:MAG: BBP7 family outer membrane beta-barrel protein [Thermoguttaceae bacterium]
MKTCTLCLTAVMTVAACGWPAPAIGQTTREPPIILVADFADPAPDAGKPAAEPAAEPAKVAAEPAKPAVEPVKVAAEPAKLADPGTPAKAPAGVVSGDTQVGCTPPACAANGGDGFCPSITSRLDFVYLQRCRPDNVPLFNDPTGMTLLEAADFKFDYRPGVDLGLTYNSCPDYGVDVRYLWLDEQGSDVAFAFPAGTSSIQTTPPSPFIAAAAGTGDFRDRSDLQTAEVLIRQHYRLFDGLLGFRYLYFHDRLNGDYSILGTPVATTAWNARNNLFGLELGASTVLWKNCRGLRIETYAKGGIYDNQAHTNMAAADSTGLATSAGAAGSQMAFVGETGIGACYPVNCHVALRVGYQGLWLSGVAVATDQVQATGAITPPPQLLHASTNGDVFYQGVSGGVEVTW